MIDPVHIGEQETRLQREQPACTDHSRVAGQEHATEEKEHITVRGVAEIRGQQQCTRNTANCAGELQKAR